MCIRASPDRGPGCPDVRDIRTAARALATVGVDHERGLAQHQGVQFQAGAEPVPAGVRVHQQDPQLCRPLVGREAEHFEAVFTGIAGARYERRNSGDLAGGGVPHLHLVGPVRQSGDGDRGGDGRDGRRIGGQVGPVGSVARVAGAPPVASGVQPGVPGQQ